MATAVEQALEQVTKIQSRSREAVDAERTKVMSKRNSLLPVEAHLKAALDEHDKALKDELTVIETFKGGTPLPMLSKEVLGWRHGRTIHGIPVPQLALISLTRGTGEMRLLCDENKSRKVESAGDFRYCYQDVLNLLGRGSRVRSETLTWRFRGVIPDATRKLIRQQQNTFSEVFLLAEAPLQTWDHTRNEETRIERMTRRAAEARERMRYLDPIVCGYAANRLWVIDVFDPTPVEQYILSEFTQKALPPA